MVIFFRRYVSTEQDNVQKEHVVCPMASATLNIFLPEYNWMT